MGNIISGVVGALFVLFLCIAFQLGGMFKESDIAKSCDFNKGFYANKTAYQCGERK